MRRYIVMMFAAVASFTAAAQGIEFQQKPYSEVLKRAKEENKLVFVDVYTSWCGPCKDMAKKVFPLEQAGSFYNKNFLNLQVDAEKSEDGKIISKEFAVTVFPTFLFINGDGELVYRFTGRRTIEKFVAEGEMALKADFNFPELKEYTGKYEKGERGRKFLEELCDLKIRSGLDCGDILLEYFTKVRDDELLDSVQMERISKISVYDRDFTRRVVDVVMKDTAELKKDRKRFQTINKAVCLYMNAGLSDIIRKNDDTGFEELMSIRSEYFPATGTPESVVMGALGGGNIYLPSNLSRLQYYAMRKNGEKFLDCFEGYMVDLDKKYKEDYESRKKLEEEMEKKLKEQQEKGNTEEYENIKKGYRLAFAFSKFDDNYIASGMIDNIPYYESFYAGEKDDAYRKRLAGWYVLLCNMSPSVKSASEVSDKLVELGHKDSAVEILKLAIEEGKEAVGVEQGDIDACVKKLEELMK